MGLSIIRRTVLLALLAGLTATSLQAADAQQPMAEPLIREAGDTELDSFLWTHRPIVVFADNPNDPRYRDQIAMMEAELDRLAERDTVVLVDTDPSANTAARQKLRPRGFMLVVMAKDGTIIVRKPSPQSVREITRSIDKMPLRKREVEERRSGG
ncbi:DUF4174 domain-containing protein [Chachezhania sediminis]|uniref:DUF4174 domain-containing protein n=1 Tax=Chachezhania sediminis TaxID=2599291 RepID=UPI00131B555E|nr:DUF4174 domain-containing protein [Chachezhania sediminis]